MGILRMMKYGAAALLLILSFSSCKKEYEPGGAAPRAAVVLQFMSIGKGPLTLDSTNYYSRIGVPARNTTLQTPAQYTQLLLPLDEYAGETRFLLLGGLAQDTLAFTYQSYLNYSQQAREPYYDVSDLKISHTSFKHITLLKKTEGIYYYEVSF